MIAGMTYYQILWYFMFYSFSGWVVEVIYHAVTKGQVINRGFLNGPVCPVYGFGVLAVVAVSNLAQHAGWITLSAQNMNIHSLVILFLGSMLFATLIEGVAGWLLDVNFHMRWWDYSKEPMNLHGYICVKFSIIWGLAITGVVLLIQPMVEKSNSFSVPERFGWPVLGIMYALAMADFAVTVAVVRGLNRQLSELDDIQKSMRRFSDQLSRQIGERTIQTAQRVEESQVQAALAKAELRDAAEAARAQVDARLARQKADWAVQMDALELRRDAILAELQRKRLFSGGNILRNVPGLKHSQYGELLETLKERIREM